MASLIYYWYITNILFISETNIFSNGIALESNIYTNLCCMDEINTDRTYSVFNDIVVQWDNIPRVSNKTLY